MIDRKRWIEKRRIHRFREEQEDSKDMIKEMNEIKDKKSDSTNRKGNTDSIETEIVQGNGNTLSTLNRNIESTVESQDVVGRIMTQKERQEAIQKVKLLCPSSQEELFAYQLKSIFIDAHLIKRKVEPFVKSKIQEFLGESEADLETFILNLVLEHAGALKMIDALKGVSDLIGIFIIFLFIH